MTAGGSAIARRFFRPDDRTTKRLRTNEQIRISPVRLIDENEQQVGIVDLDDALRRAREAVLDLVEVAPTSKPPVCRIMDYGKWKYQQKKKEQKARSHTKHSELKEVRLRPKIDIHDRMIKVGKARQFLGEGHKVQFTMLFRGREMAHRELGIRVMNEVRDTLADLSKVETHPRMMGRRMTMVLAVDSKPAQKRNATPAQPAVAQRETAPPTQA